MTQSRHSFRGICESTVQRDDPIGTDEAFNLGLHYFRKALEVMSADPDTQCRVMGDFNVAYELRDDVSSGVWLLEVAEDRLTDDQKKAIWQIGKLLRKIEASVLSSATTHEENVTAMQNPCWTTIRAQAADLLALLPDSKYGD